MGGEWRKEGQCGVWWSTGRDGWNRRTLWGDVAKLCSGKFLESTTVILVMTLTNGWYKAWLAIFSNQLRLLAVKLECQPSHKTSDLQSVLSWRYSGGNGDLELIGELSQWLVQLEVHGTRGIRFLIRHKWPGSRGWSSQRYTTG